MSQLSNLFGGGSNPMDDANQYYNQIPGVAHDTYDDYITQGKKAGGITQDEYEGLINDPTGFINKIMQNYKNSEGYTYQKNLLTKELGNSAAAGGVAGTPLDQMNQGTAIQGLLSKDMEQFLQNVLGRYDTGLKGEEGVANRGYNASGKLGDTLVGNLNQQGSLAFQNAQQNNADKNGVWKMFGKALGTGAGFALGGPAGALAGGGLGSSMFGGG